VIDREPETAPAAAGDETPARPAKSKQRHIVRWVLLGLLAVIVLLGLVVADAYAQSYRIYRAVKPVIPQLEQAQRFLAQGTVPPGDPLGLAIQTAERAQQDAGHARFTFRLTGSLPFLGRPVKAARIGAAAAGEAAQAATTIRDMATALLGSPTGGDGHSPVFANGTVDVGLLEGIVPNLQSLIDHLQAVKRDIAAIPDVPFAHDLPALKAKAIAESDRAIALADQAMVGARLLPSFFGADGPKTYFLAMQNNADQRATGGDVLAYGFVRIVDGHLKLLAGGGIRDIDNPNGFSRVELPADLKWYLSHMTPRPRRRIANINLTPNFPVVAQAWSALIKRATGRQIDGAFAIDPMAIAQLLGDRSLHVDAFSRPLNAGNLVQMVENQQYRLAKWVQNLVPQELIAASWGLFTNPPSVLDLVHRLGTTFKEKHFQVWSANPDLQSYIAQLGWSGGFLNHQTGDYLSEVDNKLLPNKVDYYTHTTITYNVVVHPSGSISSTCTIRLVNQTPPGQSPPITDSRVGAVNRALITLFVPSAARLLTSKPVANDPVNSLPNHTEDGLLVFGRALDAWPGSPGEVSFGYEIPGVIQTTQDGHVYQLTIQHQPMVNPAQLTVTVTLPEGTTARAISPDWTVHGNVATLRVALTSDFVTQLGF
jgi:hypothetical protein